MKKMITVEGMMCGMCEAHVNDALRKVPGVRKASSSRARKQAVVECDETVSDEMLLEAIQATGYQASDVRPALDEKRGLFGRRKS